LAALRHRDIDMDARTIRVEFHDPGQLMAWSTSACSGAVDLRTAGG
jgi:hypothetical protein